MTDEVLDLVVVGAGISGLSAAAEASKRAKHLLVLESSSVPGGVIQTSRKAGYLYECGPNAFRIHAEALQWLSESGFLRTLIPAGPESKSRALFLDNKLLWLPESFLGLLTTPLISTGGKFRAISELFRKAGNGDVESVSDFICRRFGPELLARAIAPFLLGVYAGDERELGAFAVFPKLVSWEKEYGSVLRGALRQLLRGGPKGLRGSYSADDGAHAFARDIAESLGHQISYNTKVLELNYENGVYRIESEDRSIFSRRVIISTPSHETARLVRSEMPDVSHYLREISYTALASLALTFDPVEVREVIRGFGFLVPREASLRLLGALFPSRVFPGRAPEGRELVMGMVGGCSWPNVFDATDEELVVSVAEGLEKTLGTSDLGTVLDINRWEHAVPQPGAHHHLLIDKIKESLVKTHPRLRLAGSYMSGVSVADTLMSGVSAARALFVKPTA